MRYFIDTNIFLYLGLHEYDELDREVQEALGDYENSIIISSESIREIGLLLKVGRLDIKKWHSYDDVKSSLDEHGIEIRHVNESHLKTFYKLRPAPSHTDPADLMIISQAITENIPLISSDAKFPAYIPQGLKFIQNNRRAAHRRKK